MTNTFMPDFIPEADVDENDMRSAIIGLLASPSTRADADSREIVREAHKVAAVMRYVRELDRTQRKVYFGW